MNYWNNKKVLVVGGAGYIGGAVTDFLIKKGIPFSVYDNLLYENHYLKSVDFIYGDVRDQEKLANILPNYSHVIWLAAIVGDGACNVKPDLTIQVNQEAPAWLAKHYQGRIIFLSTCSVYGQNDNEVNEESLLNPLSLYAKTKVEAEKSLLQNNSLIFRLGTVFGVSDNYSRLRMDLAVNYMTARALTHGKLTIFGGNQWRPLIHVKSVAEVIVNALEKEVRGIFNISAFNYKISDLGKEIADTTRAHIEYVDLKFEDLRNYHVSVKKAEQAGFLPLPKALTVLDGVLEISNLVANKRLRYTDNDLYSNERYLMSLPEETIIFKKPRLIEGGLVRDERGQVTFCNDFAFEKVKRFYTIENASLDFARAFHGHKKEEKYMLVTSGKALICAVKFPEKENAVHRFILSADQPKILHIPGGFANGIKALTPDTKVMVFSTSSLEESKQDDFRFPADYWGNDIWQENLLPPKKKVLLLGADGMLGSMMYSVFREKYDLILAIRDKNNIVNLEKTYGVLDGHTVLEFDIDAVYQDYVKGFKNLSMSPSFKNFLVNVGEIDALVNCSGIIIPHSLKDPAFTFFLNSVWPHLLASVFGQKMIHITTDCVFNGLNGFPYNEDSPLSATDLYGVSKFLGEPKNCLTLRTSIIGPEISGFFSLLEWFKKQQGQTIKGFTQHFWNGLTTKEFAKICLKIIDHRAEYPATGLFHIFSSTLSKYEMLLAFQKKYQIDCRIIPDDSLGINRTLSTIHPVCDKLQIASFDKMLQEL